MDGYQSIHGQTGLRLSKQIVSDLRGFQLDYLTNAPANHMASYPSRPHWPNAIEPRPVHAAQHLAGLAPGEVSRLAHCTTDNRGALLPPVYANIPYSTPALEVEEEEDEAKGGKDPSYRWAPDYSKMRAVWEWLEDSNGRCLNDLGDPMDGSDQSNRHHHHHHHHHHYHHHGSEMADMSATMPSEIFHKILTFLPPESLGMTAAVNHTWRLASLETLKSSMTSQLNQLQLTLNQQYNVSSLFLHLYQDRAMIQSPLYITEAIRVFSDETGAQQLAPTRALSLALSSAATTAGIGNRSALKLGQSANVKGCRLADDSAVRYPLSVMVGALPSPPGHRRPGATISAATPIAYPHDHSHGDPLPSTAANDFNSSSTVNHTIKQYLYELRASGTFESPSSCRLHTLQIELFLSYLSYLLTTTLPNTLRRRLYNLGQITQSINPKWLADTT
ncbi:hypothetical protein H4R33_002963 [Dimargaris cristalligena]|uniref:F-box domain-containing protein n=1 Tax=Dimargaris cristalligena TaxID=215637 RepID=A0A4P9ZXN9_9FUNG|nr:hypothetical protein H4R33_002963 [Dimargaris cristalligena]RKP38436.1 hypothetical protein BJ085DRAFT_37605 [Dimargaris cristalligena]|eukprot:RKP38436.1 hypothetical protein BJ085DRAFT_37605 [Dimargaris cristalligena]